MCRVESLNLIVTDTRPVLDAGTTGFGRVMEQIVKSRAQFVDV